MAYQLTRETDCLATLSKRSNLEYKSTAWSRRVNDISLRNIILFHYSPTLPTKISMAKAKVQVNMLKAMEERMVAQIKTTMAATEAATAKDHHCKGCALNKTTTRAEAEAATATVTAEAATATVTDQVGLRDRAQRAVEVTKVLILGDSLTRDLAPGGVSKLAGVSGNPLDARCCACHPPASRPDRRHNAGSARGHKLPGKRRPKLGES